MKIDEIAKRVKAATVSGHDLKKTLSGGDTPAGQFRVKWLRRVLEALWCIAAGLTAFFFLLEVIGLGALIYQALRMPSGSEVNVLGRMLLGYVWGGAFISLIYELWVGAALFYLLGVWVKREDRDPYKAKAWHVVAALALILGRGSGFWWSFAFALIPNWWPLFPIKFILLPPLTLLIGGVFYMFSLFFSITAGVLLLVVVPVKIYEAVFNISNTLTMEQVTRTPFISAMVQFWYWFTGRTLPPVEAVPDDTKGARFATPKEILQLKAESQQKNARASAVFGHVGGLPLPLYTDKHILIMASTRSGKGVALIIPHLLRYTGSAFVLDPKGENAKATGRHRATLNDKVLYLDPFGISGKPQARFNPLSRLTPENMEAESKALANALVMGERGVRDHWTASAQQLVAAIIMHVYTSRNIPPENTDLPEVRRVLLSRLNEALAEMMESDAADGLLASLAISFLRTPEKELGSIISTAQRETEILDNPFLIKCLKAEGPGDEVNFADWHHRTMTVFLCLSAPKFPVFSRWLRLVLTSALDEMTDSLNPPSLPVCFMLDELATLGHLQAVENAVGLAAGYGIQLVTVFQDVAQMKDLYKGRWASFIGNAGIKAIFNTDDFETAKYWSDFLGGHLEESMSQQKDVYGFVKGQTASERYRPLLAPDEIMLQFAQGKMLVLPQGSRPLITDRVAYFNDLSLTGLWDDPRKPVVVHKPVMPPTPPPFGPQRTSTKQIPPIRQQPSKAGKKRY